MSVDSRPTLRARRASKNEPDRPDYSEPEFTSWAAKLDDFAPAAKAAPEPVSAPVSAVVVPEAEAFDERPSLEAVLERLLSFDGAMCVALVDSESGMILGKAGSGVDMDLAAAGASVILRARLASTKALGDDEKIDDVLISLTSQVQIIHPLPSNPAIFTYLIGDKSKSSLAMARYKATEADLQIQL
jgi:predicted regulator of Ras-like GTPase activity (Roadblock/LC7/MglB family)